MTQFWKEAIVKVLMVAMEVLVSIVTSETVEDKKK